MPAIGVLLFAVGLVATNLPRRAIACLTLGLASSVDVLERKIGPGLRELEGCSDKHVTKRKDKGHEREDTIGKKHLS